MTSSYLLDADAFHALRTLGLIEPICQRLSPDRPLLMTAIIARIELNPLQRLIAELVTARRLVVHEVGHATPAGRRFKELRRNGVDRGEAEAIAWSLETASEPPIFVSVDARARKEATKNGLTALDVMGAIVDWIEDGMLDRAVASQALGVWADRSQECGRPKDFTDFQDTYGRRLEARARRLR